MSASLLRALLITDPLIALLTAIMGTISLLVSLVDARGFNQHRVARLWSRMLLAVSGVKVRIEGLEKIRPGASYVFVSNHLSLMDTPLVLAHVPAQFRFLFKESLLKVPFIGFHLRRAGHIAVPREDVRASLRSMTAAARAIREQGVSILIFPEGGRSAGQLQEFKEGAAYIAIKAGVPVVPLGILGTRAVLPASSIHVRGGSVRLIVGNPVPTTGLTTHDHARLTQQLRERVAELIGQTVNVAQ